MQKVEFEMSRSLLKDVISRQTGSLSKAIKELVQNAWDAGATKIDIMLNEKALVVTDNGEGMEKSTIDRYFKIFGDSVKRNEKNSIGEFGMGRGQIMPFGKCLWLTKNNSLYIEIDKFLGYIEKKKIKYLDGTKVICFFDKKLDWWNIYKAKETVKNEMLPGDTEITLNNTKIIPIKKVYDNYSNENFEVFEHTDTKNKLYAQGLYVEDLKSNFKYCINIKKKVKLNFARNQILETDPINEEIRGLCKLLERTLIADKVKFDKNESRTTVNLILDGVLTLEDIKYKKIIRTSNDRYISLDELIGKEIMYGKNDIWSNDCINKGMIVLTNEEYIIYEKMFNKLDIDITSLKEEPKDISKRGFHKKAKKKSLKRNKIYFYYMKDINEIICEELDYELIKVKLGYSDISDSWYDDDKSRIYINKNVIELTKGRELLILKIWELLCHEYAHGESSMEKDKHDKNFCSNYHEHISYTVEAIGKYIKKATNKYIKEKYIEEGED